VAIDVEVLSRVGDSWGDGYRKACSVHLPSEVARGNVSGDVPGPETSGPKRELGRAGNTQEQTVSLVTVHVASWYVVYRLVVVVVVVVVTEVVVVAIGRVAADGEIGAPGDVMPWLKRGRRSESKYGAVSITEAGETKDGRVYGFVGYCVWWIGSGGV
jgi:hypothetical protein